MAVPEELLAALSFADLGGPVPPWSTGGPEWEPGNGGLTERHIQASVGRRDGRGVGVDLVSIRFLGQKIGKIGNGRGGNFGGFCCILKLKSTSV